MTIPKKRFLGAALAGVVACASLSACGLGSDDKSLTIPIAAGWDEDIAVSHLWKHVLEEEGYDVDLKELDIAPVFVGVAKGNADIFLDTWLPDTHKKYWDEYGDEVDDLGTWYDGEATNNITVPEYMDVGSIDELEDIGDDVDWTITGIDAGAGLTQLTEGALDDYGLEDAGYELKTSSTPAMITALEKATKAEKPIIVTLWRPHWAYKAFDVKDLEDPEGSMGKGEELHAITREGFQDDFPDVHSALEDFEMTDDMLADLENTVLQEHDDEEEGTKAWVEDNQKYVDDLMK